MDSADDVVTCSIHVAQLSQRDRAVGCVSFGQKWKTKLGDNILRTLQVYLQPLWHNRPAKLSNLMKKRKIKAITPFKVIEVGTNRATLTPTSSYLFVWVLTSVPILVKIDQ